MAISPQRLTIYLYSAHRAVVFAIAQLSCSTFELYLHGGCSLLCRKLITDMSGWPWPFSVMWRHRARDHSIRHRPFLYWWYFGTDPPLLTVFEILASKHTGVTTLTYHGRVTSSVTRCSTYKKWLLGDNWPCYRWRRVTMIGRRRCSIATKFVSLTWHYKLFNKLGLVKKSSGEKNYFESEGPRPNKVTEGPE